MDKDHNKDQPPIYSSDYNAITDTQSTPSNCPNNRNHPNLTTPNVSISYAQSHQPHQYGSQTSQSLEQFSQHHSTQHYQVRPTAHAHTHYNSDAHIIPQVNYNHPTYQYTPNSDRNHHGVGTILFSSGLAKIANFPKYSNSHPVYSNIPLEYHNPEVLPDVSILSPETIDVYYDPANSKFDQRTNTTETILGDVEPITRHPFRRPSCCSVFSVMTRVNRAIFILSICISISSGIFIYKSLTSPQNNVRYHYFLGMLGLFLYLIYIMFFVCLKSRMNRFKHSNIVAIEGNSTITDYSIVANSVSSSSAYMHPPDIEQYITHLQRNAAPRLYLNILALEKNVRKKHISWSTTYHALRPVPIHAWKDISISSNEFLQNLEESGDNFFKVKYQYEYYLTPGQQKLLELMALQSQKEESWRGELVCVFVTYNTDLQDMEKVVASPFATKVYNPTGNLYTNGTHLNMTVPQPSLSLHNDHPNLNTHHTTTATSSPNSPTSFSSSTSVDSHNGNNDHNDHNDTSYLRMETPGYQAGGYNGYNNISSDRLVSYDTQVQTHYVLAYKEKRCNNIIRILLFNPIFEWFFVITVFFSFLYAFIYRYCISDYIYYNRKFLSISSKVNPANDIVQLDVMPHWRIKPVNVSVPNV